MAYESIHDGITIDAAVSQMGNVEAVRQEVEANKGLAQDAASQAALDKGAAQTARDEAESYALDAGSAKSLAELRAGEAASSANAASLAKEGAETAEANAQQHELKTKEYRDQAAQVAAGNVIKDTEVSDKLAWSSDKTNTELGAKVSAADLADDTDPAKGAANVGYLLNSLGAAGRTQASKNAETVSIIDFGAIGDGALHTVAEWIIPSAGARYADLAALQVDYPHVTSTTDCLNWAAAQAAINYIRTKPHGGKITLPDGEYAVAGEVDCFPAVPIELCWSEGALVLCAVTGAGSVLFNGTHPTTPETRGQQLSFTEPYIRFHSSVPSNAVGAVFIEKQYASNFKLNGLRGRLLHYRSNTAMRLSGLFNCDMQNLVVWGAGVQKSWKLTGTSGATSAQYSISNGSTALTSDIDVFDSADVGHILVIQSSGAERYEIASVEGPRAATVTKPSYRTFSGVRGNWEGVKGSISASSTTLTLEKSVLDSSDIGRVIYVLGAEDGFVSGAATPLRATIVSVDPGGAECELDTPAARTVSDVYISFSPAVEMYAGTGTNGATNDMVWDGLHLEEIRGTGLVILNATNVSLANLKLHALNGTYHTAATLFRGLFAAVGGHVSGDFEGACNNGLGDVHVSGQSGLLTFSRMTGTKTCRNPLIYAENCGSSSATIVGDWGLNNPGLEAEDAPNAFVHVGAGQFYRDGMITMYNQPNLSPKLSERRTVFGDVIPIVVPGQVAVTAASGPPRMDLISKGGTGPIYGSVAYGGEYDEPTSVTDYQTMLWLRAHGMNGLGVVQDGAGILVRARSPDGTSFKAEMLFYTRGSDGYLARFSISPEGNLVPAGGSQDIGTGAAKMRRVYSDQFRPGSGAPIWTSGAGSPEGSLWAPIGSLYTRTDGGAGSTLYVKESGAGNTGWVAK